MKNIICNQQGQAMAEYIMLSVVLLLGFSVLTVFTDGSEYLFDAISGDMIYRIRMPF